MTKNVLIDTSRIFDWDSFHDTFASSIGFPGFYGRNMNAWIDCMTYLDDPNAGMSSLHVAGGDVIVLCLTDASGFRRRCPEIYQAIIECSAIVNFRRIEQDEPAILALSFCP